MTIDNFDLFRSKLTFLTKADRYIIHVLCRPKDIPEDKRVLGANEHQRLIRTWYIDSLEYYDKKIEAIKTIAKQNYARAYILPQVRDNIECLWNLSRSCQDAIYQSNFSVKPEHLLRSAYCECHKSRDKKWILDLDNDCMTEYLTNNSGCPTGKKEWSIRKVLDFVKDNLKSCGKDPDSVYIVPTRNGHHIITTPFDLQKAFKKCNMFYEGVQKKAVDIVFTGPYDSEIKYKEITGWLHKDGMSLLYYTDGEKQE